MMIGSVGNSAYEGIRRGVERAQDGAQQIAEASKNQASFERTTRALVEVQEASNQVKTSATTLKAGDEAMGTLLDVLA